MKISDIFIKPINQILDIDGTIHSSNKKRGKIPSFSFAKAEKWL
jgi:hypothetical protein